MPELSLFETDAINRIGVYDQIKSLSITRKLRRPSTFRLELATQIPRYEEIIKGRYVGLSDIATDTINRVMRIDQLERSTEADSVIITGTDFAGWFDYRICLPPAGQSHHTFSDEQVETIIKTLVSFNAGPTAAPARVLPNLVIEADSARGATTTVQARYQALSDMLEEVLIFDGGGYEVVYLPGPTNMHQFRYISPTDRSASVFFDLEFESVSAQNWIQSDIDMRNSLYVAGQGEGADRLIVQVFPSTGDPTGLARREAFVDARDLSDADAVTARGTSILERMIEENRFTATLYERGSFRYGTHFFLGDIVTIQNRKWNLSVPSRVISATLTWSDTEQPAITLELDRPWPTLKERTQQSAHGLSQVSTNGAVDNHSENHHERHERGGEDLLVLNPAPIAASFNDTTIPTGFYSFSNPTNAPSAEVYWHVYINRWPDTQGYVQQIASPIYDTAKLYYRGYNVSTGTWSPWVLIPNPAVGNTWTGAHTFVTAYSPAWGNNGSRTYLLTNFNYAASVPSGFYSHGDDANAPITGNAWQVYYNKYYTDTGGASLYSVQIASSIYDPTRLYIRGCSNNVWSAWTKISTSLPHGWYTLGTSTLPAQASVWDVTFANPSLYNALRLQCTFYLSAAYGGSIFVEPVKLNTPFIHNTNISMVTTKHVGGAAPASLGYNEITGGIRVIDAGNMYAADYGHTFNIEFYDTNGFGLLTWKSDGVCRHYTGGAPEHHMCAGYQRGAHVYGVMQGFRLSLTGPTAFTTSTYVRIMGRRTEVFSG